MTDPRHTIRFDHDGREYAIHSPSVLDAATLHDAIVDRGDPTSDSVDSERGSAPPEDEPSGNDDTVPTEAISRVGWTLYGMESDTSVETALDVLDCINETGYTDVTQMEWTGVGDAHESDIPTSVGSEQFNDIIYALHDTGLIERRPDDDADAGAYFTQTDLGTWVADYHTIVAPDDDVDGLKA